MLKQKPQKALQWQLIDAGGKVLKAGVISDLKETISVRGYTAGMYYLKFTNGKYFQVVIVK